MSDIFLRAIEPADYKNSLPWRNNKKVTDQLGGVPFHISEAMEKEWYEENAKYDKHNIRLAICLKKGSKHIGNVYIRNIDYISRNGEFSILIGDEKQWGKNYGYIAAKELIDYGFFDLGLHKIYLYVLSHNKKAMGLYEKLGFVKEGLLKGHIYKNGSYKDFVFMSLFSSKWEKSAKRVKY